MKILMIAINDPAGTAIAFTKAINQYTEHTCRLITKEIRYNFMFEKDLHLPWLEKDGWDEVEALLMQSDVFHFHMTSDEYIDLGPFRPVDYIRGKIIVHHHHGHPDFRRNPEKYRRKYRERRRRNLLVSTPDLLKLLPEAKWQPNLVPVDDPLYSPMEDKPEDPVIICHSPTRKELKNTAEFIKTANEIELETNEPIEFRLIENRSHKECLRLKRESHVLFDHMQGYFGVSSLEALSQGLCVIAGLNEWNKKVIQDVTRQENLPWILAADGEQLKSHLKKIISNKEYRQENGIESRKFMEMCWTEPHILKILLRNIECYN